jgi:hypothetical protein
MAKISIDRSDRKMMTKKMACELFLMIDSWLELQGETADIVEVITVKISNQGRRCKYISVGMVAVDPSIAHEGMLIHDKNYRYEEGFLLRLDDEDICLEPISSLPEMLSQRLQDVLKGRADKLKCYAGRLEEIAVSVKYPDRPKKASR